ncbi:MAG TPA: cyclic nucleotide-binding domain-containing protein [Verrucomicrobiales bacterium]|nr:cyclic nucleotide-binding domain-containing protein [Verrucomicrobiales bacterium]
MREIPYLHRRGELPPSLLSLPLLARLNEPGRDEILRHATLLECEMDDNIVRECDSSDAFYILLKGALRVRKGRQDIASIRTPGEIFGEMGLLRDEPRSATVTAAEHAFILKIGAGFRDSFDTLAGARASALVLRFIAESLAERLETTSQRLTGRESATPVYRI